MNNNMTLVSYKLPKTLHMLFKDKIEREKMFNGRYRTMTDFVEEKIRIYLDEGK